MTHAGSAALRTARSRCDHGGVYDSTSGIYTIPVGHDYDFERRPRSESGRGRRRGFVLRRARERDHVALYDGRV
eukprot:1841003-Pyramimonas_sp.AAC.1